MLTLLVCCLVQQPAVADNLDPQAAPEAIVTSGRARFTVLTPQMIRIQYSTRQQFEDRATFAVVNRRLPVPQFTTREEGSYLYIETEALTLRYRKNAAINPALKSPAALQITLTVNGRETTWYPGKDDALNLRGTRRTLDGGSGDNYRYDLEPGILSRSGWAIIDESPKTKRGDGSTTFAFEHNVDGIPWVAEPVDPNAYDWYFMGYGHDYRQALADYTKIAGRQPMPPLYALGYWYSKYQRYTQQEFINLTNEIKQNDIPIDVMIMDMDWHLDGWTGWTWNKSIIPNPTGLIRWMHQQGLKVALNLHPADGVASYEDHYDEIAADMDIPFGERVPWMLEDSTFYRSMFKHIIRERESEGVDFWWIDWQQNLTSNYIAGLSETFWCNHVFYGDMREQRTDRRPMIFHRWGGMGSHRYPIGFSGDTYGTFGSLAFQPYFTATASNVCFGYWGHDIGGHLQIGEKNPELMLRWLQYGVFSPIFRTHGASQAGNERRIWMYPNFPLMLDCVNLRYHLMPYIYTAARQAYDTGVSICRPLYYYWPEENEAYRQEGEYMFGDDILVSPVVTAADNGTKAFHKTWLPEGQWFDVCRNVLVEGDRILSDEYDQHEIPYFLRAGAIIPCYPKVPNLKERPAQIILEVAPGADGATQLYEDDGDSQGYQDGAYSLTTIRQTRTAAATTLNIMPREGSFEGMPAERSWQIVFLNEERPLAVTIDGQPTDGWTYDELTHRLTIDISPTACSVGIAVALVYSEQATAVPYAATMLQPTEQKVYDLQGRWGNQPSYQPFILRQKQADGSFITRKFMNHQ